jgi:hypothetical protein
MQVMHKMDYLLETGLLFEINRAILHPLGLALAVVEDSTGSQKNIIVMDYSSDPEGMIFTEEAYWMGTVKLDKFMEEFGILRLQQRKEKLGFVVQELESVVEEDKKPSAEELQEILDSEEELSVVTNKDGSLSAVPLVDVAVRNAELKKKHANKGGPIESGDDIKPPQKDAQGNCLHINTVKEKLPTGGSLLFCGDCGQPLNDAD